jgi:cell division transport system permease protein
MTYLAILAAAGGLTLSNMAHRWSEVLTNQLTIEIPGLNKDGQAYSDSEKESRLKTIQAWLENDPMVTDTSIKSEDEVGKMLEPWLGDYKKTDEKIILPSLITVAFKGDENIIINRLKSTITTIITEARIDGHQSWLNDLLRFTGTLSFASYLVGLITAITTIIAVGGAVRARMAANQDQLEILHLIGATDEYITHQFQRHAMQLSFIGTTIGFLIALMSLFLIDQLAGQVTAGLIPSLVLSQTAILILIAIPLIICLITILTTRLTALKSLKDMP